MKIEKTTNPNTFEALAGGFQSERVPPGMPWLDLQLTKKAMDYLWDDINNKKTKDVTKGLAGNISKSEDILDKDNWFYENVLKRCVETMYFRDWNNYYNVHIAKTRPPPIYRLQELWVNYQKQHEFNPLHGHNNGVGFSFVVFMKIPTHWKEQHALPFSAISNAPVASDFQFILGNGREVATYQVPLSPKEEGRMLFFPAWLKHQVFPFYGTKEERITVSGNIY